MSILADLLSKKNLDESRTGKDIPPTLARAQGAAVQKHAPKKRYVVITIVSVAIVGVGLVMSLQWGRLITPKPVKFPLPPPAVTPVVPPQATVAPPPQPAQHEAAATTAPSPVAEIKSKSKVTFATKHIPKPHKYIAVKPKATQRQAASGSSEKSSVKNQHVASESHTGALTPPQPDTGAKGALLYAARSAEQAGDWRLALANYRRALEIDPENYKIMSNSAAALNNLGMFEEGGREAKRALDRKRDYIPAMINYAIACSSRGSNQDALHYFSAAFASDPSNRNLAINLGILQERMGKLDEARVTYQSLAESGDPQALMGLARICERRGDRSGATGNYRRILALRDASLAMKKAARDGLARQEDQ